MEKITFNLENIIVDLEILSRITIIYYQKNKYEFLNRRKRFQKLKMK